MKTLVVMAALAVTLSTAVQAQDYPLDDQPRDGTPRRQARAQGGQQFRGGYSQQNEEGGPSYQRRMRAGRQSDEIGPVGRQCECCPQCGAPVRERLRQGRGSDGQSARGYAGDGWRSRLGATDEDPAPLPRSSGQRGPRWRQDAGFGGNLGNGPQGRGFVPGGSRGRSGWIEPDLE